MEFRTSVLVFERNPFEELFGSVRFEDTGEGRQGAVLVEPDEAGDSPLVRTTTRYALPAQVFRAVHRRLARQIQPGFNNALIESYTNAYTKMGAHSDQALDLADGSTIALFSCYRDPAQPPRTLVVEPKAPGGRPVDVSLTHLSVVQFSLDTNRRFKHRIVLKAPPRAADDRWLGITFRTSKTHLRWREGRPHLSDGSPLSLADEDQRREFLQLKGRENREPDFVYPPLTYTLSESDLLPPE